ncbi:MAG: hypothetical protein AAGB51_06255 [Planctomycetota bacterium]
MSTVTTQPENASPAPLYERLIATSSRVEVPLFGQRETIFLPSQRDERWLDQLFPEPPLLPFDADESARRENEAAYSKRRNSLRACRLHIILGFRHEGKRFGESGADVAGLAAGGPRMPGEAARAWCNAAIERFDQIVAGHCEAVFNAYREALSREAEHGLGKGSAPSSSSPSRDERTAATTGGSDPTTG